MNKNAVSEQTPLQAQPLGESSAGKRKRCLNGNDNRGLGPCNKCFRHVKKRMIAMWNRGFGQSKYNDRKKKKKGKRNEQNKEKIYSQETFKLYLRHWKYYLCWLNINHVRATTLAEAFNYIQLYLSTLDEAGYSPYTIKLAGCAILKLYPGHYLGEYKAPRRSRNLITRSRNHDLAYCIKQRKDHQILEIIGTCIGLRKKKELKRVKGIDLVKKNGQICINIKGKGGLCREAPVIGYKDTILDLFNRCGTDYLINDKSVTKNGKLPKNYDGHFYRAIYAVKLYIRHARPINQIPQKDKYLCRDDYKNVVLDKKAMIIVSEALGHHRINIVAQSYVWPLVTMPKEIRKIFGFENYNVFIKK